jgi:hypothetical protein
MAVPGPDAPPPDAVLATSALERSEVEHAETMRLTDAAVAATQREYTDAGDAMHAAAESEATGARADTDRELVRVLNDPDVVSSSARTDGRALPAMVRLRTGSLDTLPGAHGGAHTGAAHGDGDEEHKAAITAGTRAGIAQRNAEVAEARRVAAEARHRSDEDAAVSASEAALNHAANAEMDGVGAHLARNAKTEAAAKVRAGETAERKEKQRAHELASRARHNEERAAMEERVDAHSSDRSAAKLERSIAEDTEALEAARGQLKQTLDAETAEETAHRAEVVTKRTEEHTRLAESARRDDADAKYKDAVAREQAAATARTVDEGDA